MFTRLDVRGFKALRDVSVPLSPFTLILGPNGCGKTSVLESIQFLQNSGGSSLPESQLSVGTKVDDWEICGHWRQDQADEVRLCKRHIGAEVPAGIPSRVLNFKSQLFSLDATSISQPCQIGVGVSLGPQGAGLSAVWDALRDQRPEEFEQLNQEVQRLLPEYDRILLKTVDAGVKIFELRTREGQHAIPARELSQGTRLALALLTMNHLPQRPDILCLEEPDHGLHPRLLRDVRDVLYRLSYPPQESGAKSMQVIATSHNPYFLELFQDHPEEVVIASKKGLSASFIRLSELPHSEEILANAPLGDCWYSGLLGGVPSLI